MITQYEKPVAALIDFLESKLLENMADERLRTDCADALFYCHKQVSSIEEKKFSTWLLNNSAELDRIILLEDNHPNFYQNNERFKKKLKMIVAELKNRIQEVHDI